MPRTRAIAAALTASALVGLLSSCSSDTGSTPRSTVTVTVTATPGPIVTPAAARPADSIAVARLIAKQISNVKKTVRITEDNDPNDKIGRPNGYVSAAVLKDSRVTCSDGLGADCGAMIEQWPSTADAKARSKYIQTILKGAPMLGSEYDTIQGRFLLRVAGDLKPSKAKAYAGAFTNGLAD